MTPIRILAFAATVTLAAACQQTRADTESDAQPPAAVAVGQPAPAVVTAVAGDTMVIYKTPQCGCCRNWVDHVKENGYVVVVHDIDQVALDVVKQKNGVRPEHASCHTAIIRGYTLEGHVPADLVARMLSENPRIRGLAVPGMPMGSPGMEGMVKQAYKVLAFDSAGRATVYAER
jgi:hypothetical protein